MKSGDKKNKNKKGATLFCGTQKKKKNVKTTSSFYFISQLLIQLMIPIPL